MPTIDWNDLARRMGSLEASGSEHAGSRMARLALEEIIGAEVFRSAVDHYVSGAPGAELARHVLWLVHPWSAMERCHEIYTERSELAACRSAIELLRVVADRRALPWIATYLADEDPEIQCWAAGIVDQLLFSDLVEEEECELLLRAMAEHPNDRVREKHAFVTQYLAERDATGDVTVSSLAFDSLVPYAHVQSVSASIQFYSRLGFTVTKTFTPPDQSEPTWAWLQSGGAALMVSRASHPIVAREQAVILVLYVENVSRKHEELKSAGLSIGEIEYSEVSPAGNFRLHDPDGYDLTVRQR